jgi:hypothetical protein
MQLPADSPYLAASQAQTAHFSKSDREFWEPENPFYDVEGFSFIYSSCFSINLFNTAFLTSYPLDLHCTLEVI